MKNLILETVNTEVETFDSELLMIVNEILEEIKKYSSLEKLNIKAQDYEEEIKDTQDAYNYHKEINFTAKISGVVKTIFTIDLNSVAFLKSKLLESDEKFYLGYVEEFLEELDKKARDIVYLDIAKTWLHNIAMKQTYLVNEERTVSVLNADVSRIELKIKSL